MDNQPEPAKPTVRQIDTDKDDPGLLYDSGKDETMQFVVHRHPFGIFAIYFITLLAIVAALALIFILVPSVIGNDAKGVKAAINGMALFAIGLVALILFLQTYIYRQNRLLVTNKNVVQILQRGLFNRKTSQLSMASVEDVNAEQSGLFSTLFNFGTLTVQTAGEQENFIFPYCPKPNFYAQEILRAREKFLDKNNDSDTG